MTEFLDMHGYGFYIWTSYGVAFAGLTALLAITLRKRAALKKELEAL